MMKIPDIKVSLNFGNTHINTDLRDELVVGGVENINDHIDTLSANYAYWVGLREEAEKMRRELDNDYRIWMAKMKHSLQTDQRVGDLKSETAKEDAVIVFHEEEYRKWKYNINDAIHSCNVLKNICDAWQMKGQLLVSLGANYRKEHDMYWTMKSKEENVVQERSTKVTVKSWENK